MKRTIWALGLALGAPLVALLGRLVLFMGRAEVDGLGPVRIRLRETAEQFERLSAARVNIAQVTPGRGIMGFLRQDCLQRRLPFLVPRQSSRRAIAVEQQIPQVAAGGADAPYSPDS